MYFHPRSLLITTVLCFLPLQLMAEVKIVRIPPPPGNLNHNETSYGYYFNALDLVLSKTKTQFGDYKIEHSDRMSNKASLLDLSLDSGELDVIWRGSNDQREKVLLPIRIPLLRGTLGLRFAVIDKKREMEYRKLTTLAELRKWKVCQGQFWADASILEQNGITVILRESHKAMAKAVLAEECDLMLVSSAFEYRLIHPEFTQLKLLNSPLVYYPLPVYFFVRQNDTQLQQRIILGLEQAIRDGSLDNLFINHLTTQKLRPLNQWSSVPIIELKNPLLTELPNNFESRRLIAPSKPVAPD